MKITPFNFSVVSFFLLLSHFTQAQNSYKPGSIKFRNGDTKEVLIKYNAWKLTPQKINYKIPGNENINTVTIEDLNEFTINDIGRYVAADVRIDVSSKFDKRISSSADPEWENQRILLEEIIGVGTRLYYHKTKSYARFFYQKEGSEDYVQLIYKAYMLRSSFRSYNRGYRKQLKDNFICPGQDVDFKSLDFNYKTIINFFSDYNRCRGFEVQTTNKPKAKINFGVMVGLSSYSGDFTKLPRILGNQLTAQAVSDFESTVGLRLGIGGELVLPYQNNQWSMIFDGQYEQFTNKGVFTDQTHVGIIVPFARGDQSWNLDLSHFIFGLGLRRYIYTGTDQKLFVNAGVNLNFALQLSSSMELGAVDNIENAGDVTLEIAERNSFFAGLGYSWSKYSFEARYGMPRELLSTQSFLSSKYNSISLIFKYQFGR
jgi:hypothetical protein